MVKHVVGKVRTPSYTLPDHEHTYGIPNKMDEHGAGSVVQSWVQTSDSAKLRASMVRKSFPATNRKALQHGCLDAKSQRQFAMDQPVLTKPPSYRKNTGPEQENDDQEHVFGIKSVPNHASIKELLHCTFKGSNNPAGENGRGFEEADYPDLTNRQTKGRLPPAKMTKSFMCSIKNKKEREESGPCAGTKSAFKMKKFLKVESKVKAMLQQ